MNLHTQQHTQHPLLRPTLPLGRSRLVQTLLVLAFFSLFMRSVYLQLIHNSFLQQKGEMRYSRVMNISTTRGVIMDRHGEVLAMSSPVKSIWAIPGDVFGNNKEANEHTPHATEEQLKQLADLLTMPLADLNSKLHENDEFVYLKRQIPPDLAGKIAELGIPGIYQKREFRRFYPSGEITAHVVGFTGVDDTGQEGIELSKNHQLRGVEGSRRVIRNRKGQIIEDVEAIKIPQQGKDTQLSIDNKLQYAVFSALKNSVDANKAKAGGAVVIDVETGEILAMVNIPTYNPNNRSNLSGAQLRNRILTDTFEPGSTIKPFIIATALAMGKVKPETPINTEGGKLLFNKHIISDAHPHGVLSVAEVIQKSSNIGAVKIAMQLPREDMWHTFDDIGFGHPTQLGFPGESTGRLRNWHTWKPIEQATMSYGHGLSVTLMQLAHAYTVFARNGEIMPLSLQKQDQAVVGKQVFPPQVALALRGMLESVTQPGGTATRAHVNGYRVAGKTGTAHKLVNGHYANKYVASFVGFAPVSNPRIVVAVMIDEPSGNQHYGGEVAAPVFADIVGTVLRAMAVSPDAPFKTPALQLEDVKESI